MYSIQDWQERIHALATEKGWFEKQRPVLELYALMISEVSEALEQVRHGKPDFYFDDNKPEGEATELADMIIRIFDYVAYQGLDLELLISEQLNIQKPTIRDIQHYVRTHVDEYPWIQDFESYPTALESHMLLMLSLGNGVRSYKRGAIELETLALAETIFKTAYYFSKKQWDLQEIVSIKFDFNQTRAYQHGGKKH